MLTDAVEGSDWHPHTARAACMAHTWVTGWHAGGVERIVAEAREEGWECVVIESTSNGPITRSALMAVHAAGATVVAPDSDQIHAALTTVDDLLQHRRLDRRRSDWLRLDQRPFLLLVGDGDHVQIEVLQRIVMIGRELDVHLAIDERARPRTPRQLDDCLLGVYRGSGQAVSPTS